MGRVSRCARSLLINSEYFTFSFLGAGSVVQHMVAHNGDTQPSLFKQAITSSTFLPSQYNFNDPIPEVRLSSSAETESIVTDLNANYSKSTTSLSCRRGKWRVSRRRYNAESFDL
jgi:hypothetical protein